MFNNVKTMTMKKIFLTLAMSITVVGSALANNYKLDEASIDAAFAASEDISLVASEDATLNFASINGTLDEPTIGGYLLRAWFCGFIGLHRSYMGTGGKTLWYYYLCIPVYGPLVACVDFWGVVFMGNKQLAKYKNNPKFNVWAGK
jgi:TM2 domain-containing membrane protein YozV